jgi:hypothetical protein
LVIIFTMSLLSWTNMAVSFNEIINLFDTFLNKFSNLWF